MAIFEGTTVPQEPAQFAELARLLNQVSDASAHPDHASEMMDEISHLLWLVSSLDPEAEKLISRSDYLAGFRSQKTSESPTTIVS